MEYKRIKGISLVKKINIFVLLFFFWFLPAPSDGLSAKPRLSPSCNVSGVDENDVLNVRQGPMAGSKKVGSIPPDGMAIEKISEQYSSATSVWFKVKYKDVTGWVNSKYLECRFSPRDAELVIADLATKVLRSLKQKDMKKFASYVHPLKGVRFSPYAHVDEDSDKVFTASAVVGLLEDKQKQLWGYYDGSGDDIQLTFADYYQHFIYSHDFLNAKQVAYNKSIGSGNTRNNLTEVYPNSTFVEYHFSGLDPKVGGTSWVSLRLVFEQIKDKWYVVSVIHAQWTI
ncbi:MAG: SH3 domain-containing protein [Desulfobacteraceae bacterium]